MMYASNASTVRDANRLAVLERVRLRAPVTRAEIARDTGLTAAAVTNIVAQLMREGLVLETGRRTQERGQPPVELDLAANAAFSVGLHLDRDLLTGVVVDLKGTVRATLGREIAPPSPDEALSLLSEAYRQLVASARVARSKILGLGVVTVGPLDPAKGTVRGPPNFPGWHEVPLGELLSQATGAPVILENNATAAAIGEHLYGAARHYPNFLYVYIGLGVGGGLFINNRVHRGSGLNAGEFGHLLTRTSEGTVPLESRTSVLALQRDLGEGFGDLDSIAQAFEREDPLLLEWLERAATALGEAVAGVDNLLDLDAVIFGGRHRRKVLEHLVKRTSEHARSHRMPNRPSYAAIISGRAGDDTAALGAATLPLYDAFVLPSR